MRNETTLNRGDTAAPDHLLKTTALIYLKEALVHQRYEECPALIRSARGYGARQSEVRKVIAEYIAWGRKGRRKRTGRKFGGRLRYY